MRLANFDPTLTPITESLKAAVRAHYGRICQYCSRDGAKDVDHIIPLSLGGPNTLGNVTLACGPCNQRKGGLVLAPLFGAIAHARARDFAPGILERAGGAAAQISLRPPEPRREVRHLPAPSIAAAFRGFMEAHRATRFSEPGEKLPPSVQRAGWRWSRYGETVFGMLPSVLVREVASPLRQTPRQALSELAGAGLILTSQEAGEVRFSMKGPRRIGRGRLVVEAPL